MFIPSLIQCNKQFLLYCRLASMQKPLDIKTLRGYGLTAVIISFVCKSRSQRSSALPLLTLSLSLHTPLISYKEKLKDIGIIKRFIL